MKKKLFFLTILFSSTAIFVQGQDMQTFYKQKIEECLDLNDCENAQKMYNAFLESGGRADSNIDARIKACNDAKNPRSASRNQAKAIPHITSYIETTNNLNIQMIAVQGGTFTMGCTSEQGGDCFNEKSVHQVTVSDYYIGKYEVTQAQWKAVMGTTVLQQRDKANENLPIYGEGDKYPMYYVSWDEVQDFISRLNNQTGKQYRLPTEAEWEFASRGGNSSRGYKYSGSNIAGKVAWYYENAGDWILDEKTWNYNKLISNNNKSHPVGKKSSNELGIYDMSGNVWEWCSDWYGNYNSNFQTDPQGPAFGSFRVVRGGSWCVNMWYTRVSYRNFLSPENRYYSLGFRLACNSK